MMTVRRLTLSWSGSILLQSEEGGTTRLVEPGCRFSGPPGRASEKGVALQAQLLWLSIIPCLATTTFAHNLGDGEEMRLIHIRGR